MGAIVLKLHVKGQKKKILKKIESNLDIKLY